MKIYTIDEIKSIVASVAEKYQIESVYLFGSYAHGEANEDSDLDFLVIGKLNFRRTLVFAFAEELRDAFGKDVDVYELHEVNPETEFSNRILKERLRVA